MEEFRFEHDEDFATRRHQNLREDGWMGGSHTEAKYLLSCLTRINYYDTPTEVWYPAAKEFVSANFPKADWIVRSTHFGEFAVLLLKDLNRQSKLGKQFPYRAERRGERAARFAMTNPDLTVDEWARRLKTTVKQLQRNSDVSLVQREYRLVKHLQAKE